MEEKYDVLNEQGEFTDKVATKKECHEKGLWHRAVNALIINNKDEILLQKRSANKKIWPNKWDVSFGGHVLAGEFGIQTVIREAKEELNLYITDNDIKYLVCATAINIDTNIINKQFNEYYLITKEIDLSKIKLQEDEVSEVKFFTIEEINSMINNNYKDIAENKVAWSLLERITNNRL